MGYIRLACYTRNSCLLLTRYALSHELPEGSTMNMSMTERHSALASSLSWPAPKTLRCLAAARAAKAPRKAGRARRRFLAKLQVTPFCLTRTRSFAILQWCMRWTECAGLLSYSKVVQFLWVFRSSLDNQQTLENKLFGLRRRLAQRLLPPGPAPLAPAVFSRRCPCFWEPAAPSAFPDSKLALDLHFSA